MASSASGSSVMVRGSTKISLNERFASLKKSGSVPAAKVAALPHKQTVSPPPARTRHAPPAPIYREPRYRSPSPPPPPRYRYYDDDYGPAPIYHHPHHIPEYRGPPRTATSMPVYDRSPPAYGGGAYPRYHSRYSHHYSASLKRPLKHRLGSIHNPRGGSAPYSRPYRGGGYRGGGRGGGIEYYRPPYEGGRGRGGYSRPYPSRGGPPERGSWRGGRGGGQQWNNPQMSKEDLDKEMDSYMAQTKGGLDKELDTYMKTSSAEPENEQKE